MDFKKKHDFEYMKKESSDTTIVFGNGFGTDKTSWTEISNHFKDKYSILLFENVGSGKTDFSYYSPHKYDNVKPYSKDFLSLAEHLKIQNCYFVGHSVSGMIGLLSAIHSPQTISKLVMIGSSPRYLNDVDYKGGFEQKDLDGLFEAMRTNFYAWASGFAHIAMNNPDKPELAEYFAGTMREIQPDIAISVAKTIFGSDHRSDLNHLKTPCLIIKTKEDIAVPPEVPHFMNKKIESSILQEVNATGHFPHISSPGEIIKNLEAFL